MPDEPWLLRLRAQVERDGGGHQRQLPSGPARPGREAEDDLRARRARDAADRRRFGVGAGPVSNCR